MDNLAKGISYLGTGETNLAEKFLLRAAEEEPERAEVWKNLGECHIIQEKYQKAKEELEKAAQLSPDDAEVFVYLSIVCENLGDRKGSVKYFLMAEEKGFTADQIYRLISHIKIFQGKFNEAQTYIERAIALAPKNPSYHNTLGIIYSEFGEWEKAAAALQRAIELAPDKDAYWFNLGNIQRNMGNDENAIRCYLKAIQLNPKEFIIWNNLGTTYMHLRNFSEAEKCLKKAIEIEPEHFRAHYNLACLYSMQEKFSSAIESLEKALQIAPEKVCKLIPRDPDLRNLWESGAISELFFKYCRKFIDSDRS